MATRMLTGDAGRDLRATLDDLGRVMRAIEPSRLAWAEPPVLASSLLEMM